MIRHLFPFIGGVKLQYHKACSTNTPVIKARIPERLVLPLRQHIGAQAEPVVTLGERVKKGQLIAKATDYISAPLHAPSSGTITHIGDHAVPHPSGMAAPCIIIETDGEDQWLEDLPHHANDYHTLDPSALRNIIRQSGIVGLGGAGFPTYVKLNPGPERVVDTLIINGAECEPFITCDDMLMRERADDIVAGLKILIHALQPHHCVIAIEDNKPEAIAAVGRALRNSGDADKIEIATVPTIYPAGGEKQLIHTVTGKIVPSNGLPIHVGVICQNIGTVVAIYNAIQFGQPLLSRYVTITGDVAEPRNLDVLIGTPVRDLAQQCGCDFATVERIIMGGPMMGFAIHGLEIPVIKTTNCLLVDGGKQVELQNKHYIMPCIRCGSCADACPVKLLPQQLYWYSKSENYEQAQAYNLFDCIECGCCDYVCPSHIPLVQHYRHAKGEIWAHERETQKADIARERHESRQKRLEREKAEREARHKKKKAEIVAKAAELPENKDDNDSKRAMILAAMERAKEKKGKQGITPKNVDNLSPEQQKLVDEAEQRRARLRTQQNHSDKDSEDAQ